MTKYAFPIAFIQDRQERDLSTGLIEYKGGKAICEPTESELDDLIDDARHYTSPDGPDEPGLQGLKASARAILKMLKK